VDLPSSASVALRCASGLAWLYPFILAGIGRWFGSAWAERAHGNSGGARCPGTRLGSYRSSDRGTFALLYRCCARRHAFKRPRRPLFHVQTAIVWQGATVLYGIQRDDIPHVHPRIAVSMRATYTSRGSRSIRCLGLVMPLLPECWRQHTVHIAEGSVEILSLHAVKDLGRVTQVPRHERRRVEGIQRH